MRRNPYANRGYNADRVMIPYKNPDFQVNLPRCDWCDSVLDDNGFCRKCDQFRR
jgi:hypothetical protein